MAKLYTASVTLPLTDNDGRGTASAQLYLRDALLHNFGGVSVSECTGYWRDAAGRVYTDHNQVYSVAIEDTPMNVDTLKTIAIIAGESAGQLAVYVTLPHGVAEIVDIEPAYVPPLTDVTGC